MNCSTSIFEVPTAVNIKINILWDVTPRRRFLSQSSVAVFKLSLDCSEENAACFFKTLYTAWLVISGLRTFLLKNTRLFTERYWSLSRALRNFSHACLISFNTCCSVQTLYISWMLAKWLYATETIFMGKKKCRKNAYINTIIFPPEWLISQSYSTIILWEPKPQKKAIKLYN